MFFDSWPEILRILIVGTCAYVGLVVLLRVSGKRTLAKMNAFDLVVTVSLGSVLATILLNRDVELAEGLTAFLLLCSLQYVVAFASVRSETFQKLIKSEPSLLFHDGRFLEAMLKQQRVTREEIYAAVRSQGQPTLSNVAAVVLETDGSFSVISAPGSTAAIETLRFVKGDDAFTLSQQRSSRPETGLS